MKRNRRFYLHSYCIVIGQKDSLYSGYRMMDSAKKQGGMENVQLFFGTMPKDRPRKIFEEERLKTLSFDTNKFSRIENAMSCFLSHFALWQRAAKMKEDTVMGIFEHDAVITSVIPRSIIDGFDKLITIGKPSYGKYRTINSSSMTGMYSLYSKKHLPGAHAYLIRPEGAKLLIEEARKTFPEPTDVFLSKQRFPWIQESSPWFAKVEETFSTVQLEKGCLAKHDYQKLRKNYRLI